MRILVVGIGYVGLSTAVSFAVNNEVDICDIIPTKVDNVNKKIPPFVDKGIEEFFRLPLNLSAKLVHEVDYNEYDFIIIAVSTNYQENLGNLDTSSIESIVNDTKCSDAITIIRSTVPFGFTENLKKKYKIEKLLYCPEFLREGTALYDLLNPSRIVIGGDEKYARMYLNLLINSVPIQKNEVVLSSLAEAEAIKLFSNSYLALRVAFFNEIDNFAIFNNLNARTCINGICLDPRIGNYYNNPSFGYGGSCLPKDTKSLKNAFEYIPNNLISAIVDANENRKKVIAAELLKKQVQIIGIYRLSAKSGTDNFRESASLGVCELLVNYGQKVIIYEPLISDKNFCGCEVIPDFAEFKERSDLIIANRIDDLINNTSEKIYTRDLFNNN